MNIVIFFWKTARKIIAYNIQIGLFMILSPVITFFNNMKCWRWLLISCFLWKNTLAICVWKYSKTIFLGGCQGLLKNLQSFQYSLANHLEKIIAQELLISVKNNATIDWNHSEIARAKIRVLVKRILKKFGYPPDLQDRAVQTVIQQAEALTSSWMNS